MISRELDSLFPKLSEVTLVLTSAFAGAEEDEDEEEEDEGEEDKEEEEEELSDAAATAFRGAGVGGINAFLLGFLSATVEMSTDGRFSGDVPVGDSPTPGPVDSPSPREAESSSVLPSNSGSV